MSHSNSIHAQAQSPSPAPDLNDLNSPSQATSFNTASDAVLNPSIEAALLPNAGIPGPIPEDFDFDGRVS